jgi:hypothetical protein
MKLHIEGAVTRALALDFAALSRLEPQIPDVGQVVRGREGSAVPLAAVLACAGVLAEADYLTVAADDGEFFASVPLDAVGEAVLVYRLGEESLPRSKGGPLRLLIPDAARCGREEVDTCANVKFVSRLRLDVGRGRDTRPLSVREHEQLHRKPGHERSRG